MKDKLFQIFFCIYIFWEAALMSVLGQRGLSLEGSTMRWVLVVIAGISWLFYLSYSPKNRCESKVVILLAIFGALYCMTQLFYSDRNNYEGYIGQFLRWGADCVSATIIGMTLMKLKNYDLIHKILPWECLALTPFVALSTIRLGAEQAMMHLDGGFNYQSVTYALAVLFCFSLYYSFIYKGKKQNLIVKIVMLLAMLIQSACCAMAGGRGGLVLLVVYIVYMGIFLIRNKMVSKPKLFFFALVSIIGFFIVANQMGVWESAGFARSSNAVNDDDRWLLWKEFWVYITKNPIIGYGLGGDYFTWGFYSHNLIVDLLLEAGLIGTIIILTIFLKTYKGLKELTNYNQVFIIIMILFIRGGVMNMFSGYWISTSSNWLAFGVAYTSANYYSSHPSITVS